MWIGLFAGLGAGFFLGVLWVQLLLVSGHRKPPRFVHKCIVCGQKGAATRATFFDIPLGVVLCEEHERDFRRMIDRPLYPLRFLGVDPAEEWPGICGDEKRGV